MNGGLFALMVGAAFQPGSAGAGPGQAPVVPEIAHRLPPTWPPPGWPTRVTLPGDGSAGKMPAPQAQAGRTSAPHPDEQPPATRAAEKDAWVSVFPQVRVNRAQKAVEFDGVVAWDFHNPDTPRMELELLVCLPMRDKEHESLVLSRAKGADVHAALLMTGFEPGTPGRIDFGGDGKEPGLRRVAPVGPEVKVEFVYADGGRERSVDAREWVIDERAGAGEAAPFGLVFAGSKVGPMRNEQGEMVPVYFADATGALVGLCTFGSETIASTRVVSPDSGVDAPRFVARAGAIPAADSPVRVRVRALTPAQAPLQPGAGASNKNDDGWGPTPQPGPR